MAVGDSSFCTNYSALPDVQARIDAGLEEFYVRYKNWQTAGRPHDNWAMLFFFMDVADVEAKLSAGWSQPSANNAGGVLDGDCQAFNSYVHFRNTTPLPTVSAAEQANANIPQIQSDPDLLAFQVALAKYFTAQTLSAQDKQYLNGALFVQVDLRPTKAAKNKKGDRRLFAIPGNVLVGFDRNLTDPGWKFVDDGITEALKSIRSNVINVKSAVQLRFGAPDGPPMYEPVELGDGMVIFGRA